MQAEDAYKEWLALGQNYELDKFKNTRVAFMAGFVRNVGPAPACDGKGFNLHCCTKECARKRDEQDAKRWAFFNEHAQDKIDGMMFGHWLCYDGVMKHGSRNNAIDYAMAMLAPNPILSQLPFKEVEPEKPVEGLTTEKMKINGRYNWKNQPERLVYHGRTRSGWHQFGKVDEPGWVWCEVRDEELSKFEETK